MALQDQGKAGNIKEDNLYCSEMSLCLSTDVVLWEVEAAIKKWQPLLNDFSRLIMCIRVMIFFLGNFVSS